MGSPTEHYHDEQYERAVNGGMTHAEMFEELYPQDSNEELMRLSQVLIAETYFNPISEVEDRYLDDWTDNVKDHFHDKLDELSAEIRVLIAEAHGNPQEFNLENPSPGLNLDYYVDRALSERELER